jgi:hypothetical protein
MSTRKAGKRHTLLIYRRAMNRLWVVTLAMGLFLGIVWVWMWFSESPLLSPAGEIGVLAGSIVALLVAGFALFGSYAAYAQPRRDHLRVVTPFLRFSISYRRVRSVHPASFQQLFPPHQASWAQESFLEPFYGKTAVVVGLSAYPMSPRALKIFLAPQMFSPQGKGFVFLVPDWMDFSTELDSFRSGWKPASGGRGRTPRRSR